MKTRKLQEIFNAVILSGIYSEDRQVYMCLALDVASASNVITSAECFKARTAIKNYLRPTLNYSLAGALSKVNNSNPYGYSDTLAIYKNWAKRPSLKPKGIKNV